MTGYANSRITDLNYSNANFAGSQNDTNLVPKYKQQVPKSEAEKLDKFISDNSDKATRLFTDLSPIIPFRRITGVPNKLKDHDYGGALISLGVAATLLPEDLRDMRDAVKQANSKIIPEKLKNYIKTKNPKFFENYVNFTPKYDYKEYQVPFSFIRGSFLEKIVNKYPNKFTYLIHQWDKPLSETKLGKFIANVLHVQKTKEILTARRVPMIINNENSYILKQVNTIAVQLKGHKINKLICRAMQRTTVYGSLALCLVSIPGIIMAFNKPKQAKGKSINTGKQILKSVINIVTGISAIALGGAILAQFGPLGSVIGMGLGCIAGGYISNRICKLLKIDKTYL